MKNQCQMNFRALMKINELKSKAKSHLDFVDQTHAMVVDKLIDPITALRYILEFQEELI